MQGLKSELEKASSALGRSAIYVKESRINGLPRYHFLFFFVALLPPSTPFPPLMTHSPLPWVSWYLSLLNVWVMPKMVQMLQITWLDFVDVESADILLFLSLFLFVYFSVSLFLFEYFWVNNEKILTDNCLF